MAESLQLQNHEPHLTEEFKYSRTEKLNSSQCSCMECNESDCFAKRHRSQFKCTCGPCTNTTTCLFCKDLNLNGSESKEHDASKNISEDVKSLSHDERIIYSDVIGKKSDYPVLSSFITNEKKDDTAPSKTDEKKDSKLILDGYDRNQIDRPIISCENEKNKQKNNNNEIKEKKRYSEVTLCDTHKIEQDDGSSFTPPKLDEKKRETMTNSPSKINEMKVDRPYVTCKNIKEKHNKSAFVSRKTEEKKYGRPILTCNINKKTNNDSTPPLFSYNIEEKKSDTPELPIGEIQKNMNNKPKSIDEKKIHIPKYACKIDSLKSETSNKYEGAKSNSKYTHKVKNIVVDGTERIEKEIVYEADQDTTTETLIHSKYSLVVLPKPDQSKMASCAKATSVKPSDFETVVNSVAVSYSRTGLKPSTHLSAQIMDVPINDFKKSVSMNKSNASPNTYKSLTRYDILKRIKEAYKACSCKICECITNIVIPDQNEVCNCKPCECLECRSYRNETNPGIRQLQPSSASETFKNNFKKLLSECKSESCDCNRCDCLECTTFNSKTCDCQPCECTACKALSLQKQRTYVVATVGEDIQRNVCTCEPCACFQCGNIYGSVARNMTHEMSTGINRHPNCHCDSCFNDDCEQEGVYTCNCDRHKKIIRKPVQADNHDFDIRTAKVSNIRNRISATRGLRRPKKLNDQVTMYTALTSYKPEENLFDTGCVCEVCDCVICKCQDKIHKLSQHYALLKKVPKSANILVSCDCKPCDCQICKKFNCDLLVSTSHQEKRNIQFFCKCETCECIQCKKFDGLSVVSSEMKDENFQTKILDSAKGTISCDCRPCECIDCQKIPGNYLSRSIDHGNINAKIEEPRKFPVYDRFEPDRYIDTLLTNSESARRHDANRALYSSLDSPQNSGENMYINYDFPENSISYTDNPYQRLEKQGTSSSKERNFFHLNTNKSKTLSCGMYLQSEKQPTSIHFDIDNKASSFTSSYESAMSSDESLCKGRLRSISCIKDRVKSWESCNSSGYDCSDYLIKFPRATVEHCINDVMNLDKKANMINLNTDEDYKNGLSHSPPFSRHIQSDKLKINTMNCNTSKPFASGHILYAKMCSKGHIKNDRVWDNSSLQQLKCSRGRCHCEGGKYWGSSLIDKRANYISKNEATQTLLKLIDRGAYSEVKNNMDFYLRSMNEQGMSPLFATSQELLVTRDTSSTLLLSNKDTVRDIENERYAIKENFCELPNYIKDNTIDGRKVNINYRCVTNTIREARAFTLELLRILDKYEKANQNFESVFEKLKKSHETILYDLLRCPNYDSSKVKSSKELGQEPQRDCHEEFDKYIQFENVSNINKTDEKGDTNTDSKNIGAMQEEAIQEIVMFTTEEPIKMKLKESSQSEEKNTSTKFNQFDNNNIDCHKIRYIKRNYTKYKKMIKRAASVARKTCLKDEIANESMIITINITNPAVTSNNVAQTVTVKQISQAIQIYDTYTDEITTEEKKSSNHILEDHINISHKENDMVKNIENKEYFENRNQNKTKFVDDVLETNKTIPEERQTLNTTEVYCLPKIQERFINFIEESDKGNDEIFEEALEFNDLNELTKPEIQNTDYIFTATNQNPLNKVNEMNETYNPSKRFCYKTLQLMQDIQNIEKYFFMQADMIHEKLKFKPKICLSTYIDTTSQAQTRTKMSKEALNLDTTHKHPKISKRSLELHDTASINTLTASVIGDSKKKVKELVSYCKQNPSISNLKEDISNKHIKLSKRSLEIDENLINNTCKQTKEELCNKIFELDDTDGNLEAIKYCKFENGYVEKQHEPGFSEHCIKIHDGEENSQVFIKTIKSDNVIKPKDNQICDEMGQSDIGSQNFMTKVRKRSEDQGLIHGKDRENRHIFQSHSFSAGTSSYSKFKELRASPTTVLKTASSRRIEDVEGSNVQTKSDLMFSLNKLQTSKYMQTSERAERTVDDKQIDIEATLKHLKDFASSPILNQNKRMCLAMASEAISKGNNTGSVSASNSICDAMKIRFESVRRVSDHTVILKWNIPSSTKGILGYELLVDGRAVQKILSPTRCLAVVTCLPHVPRLLLTVRTITADTTGRYPTATIVYHPRV